LPGGPVGPPALWAATPDVTGRVETAERAQRLLAKEGGLYMSKLFAEAPEFLVTPLLIGPLA